MSPLQQRLLTAAVLIPLVVLGVLKLPPFYFSLLAGLFAVGGAWEWSRLAGWESNQERMLYLLLFALGLLGAEFLMEQSTLIDAVLGAALVWWCIALFLVLEFQLHGRAHTGTRLLRGLIGWFILLPTWLSLAWIHSHPAQGPYLVLFLLVLIWGADSAAYFAGRRWGKTRLASRVSPKKSWEGVAGGIAAVLLLSLATHELLGVTTTQLPWFLALVLITAMASLLGDLMESFYKRQAGLKDSGSLLPGHGGVLDRIDSLTAAAPLFALGQRWIGGLGT